ncbi:PAS domain S-box-containing protein [Oxalobacteraceae bacterium GrIS 2.11]
MVLPKSLQQFIQSRWPWLALSLILTATLFLTATIGWFWYIDQRDSAARALSLDLLWLEQNVTQSLNDNQRMMEIWARDLQQPTPRAIAEFLTLSNDLMKENQALIAIDYLDRNGRRIGGLPGYTERPQKLPPLTDPLVTEAIQHSLAMKKPGYSRVIEQYAPLWVLAVPISDEASSAGVVLLTYDLDQLLSAEVPWWFVQRYDLSLVDRDDKQLSPHDGNVINPDSDIHKLNFGPDGSGLSLHASLHATNQYVKPIFWLSVAVIISGLLIIWLLRLLQRWLRERLDAQQALSNELGFREAMEQSLVTGLMAFDNEGKIIYVNPGVCTMLGWHAESLIGTSAPFRFWHPEFISECYTAHTAMLRGDNPEQGRRLNLIDSSGTKLAVRLFASRLVSGVSNGWMVSLYDTTELQKEREALASSREQLYLVLSGLDAAVFVSRVSDGQLLFRNHHNTDLFKFEAAAECCLISWPGVPHGVKITAIEFDDAGRWYHLERRIIEWVDGSPVSLDIATDITAEREAMETARERDELLQRTARLANLAEFATGIAHELNQPLTAIANYSAVASAYLATDPPQIHKINEAVQLMGEESTRAGKIIQSMRNFIQKRTIRHDQHNLYELLAQPLLSLRPLAQRLQFGIGVEVPDRSIVIDCDPVMIEQVIFNLIRNGLEAVATIRQEHLHEAVKLQIRREMDDVVVSVSDCGPGLSDPDKLFQPFYTTKSEGMGLGLAICRTVIESHGGVLWAEPNKLGGVTFSFKLRCNANSEFSNECSLVFPT